MLLNEIFDGDMAYLAKASQYAKARPIGPSQSRPMLMGNFFRAPGSLSVEHRRCEAGLAQCRALPKPRYSWGCLCACI